jgi:hypothetical protein
LKLWPRLNWLCYYILKHWIPLQVSNFEARIWQTVTNCIWCSMNMPQCYVPICTFQYCISVILTLKKGRWGPRKSRWKYLFNRVRYTEESAIRLHRLRKLKPHKFANDIGMCETSLFVFD